MALTDIIHRSLSPQPWAEGDNIPWDDPAFSARMLNEHLSQSHDLASRRQETIAKQLSWIHEQLLANKPRAVLELACGPGLYLHGLARRGHRCVGIDFGPASVDYAARVASKQGLNCKFVHDDIRTAEFGSEYDLVMLIYGQFNVFRRPEASDILRRARNSLASGGRLLIEPQLKEWVRGSGTPESSWSAAEAGLFSNSPHILLHERFWNEPESTTTERWHVIDAATGKVARHAMSYIAYDAAELQQMLNDAGFASVERLEKLGGPDVDSTEGLWALVAS